ncbi:glycosyltransferase family 4 protein [Saccharicrinis sp. FJH62]|uniref:glycosyltransferase family 4 protein n=1 Tax=Saccharicrinis sp. FJH62 TaxID=3344657 RepID=UPI0035D4C7D3
MKEKITIVCTAFPEINNPKVIFTFEMAKALKDAGIDMEVVDLGALHIQSDIAENEYNGIKIYRFKRKARSAYFKSILKYRKELKRILKQRESDAIVLSFLRWEYIFYFDLIRKNSKKIGWIVHGQDAMCLWENKFITTIKRRMLKRVDNVFPVSDYTKFLVETILPPKEYHKIVLNYNGVDKEKCNKALNLSKEAARAYLSLPEDIKIVLSVSELKKRKGIDEILRAEKIIKEKQIEFLHIIIGRGDERQYLMKLAKDLGISNSVKFIDFVESGEDLMKYFRAADVFALLSKTMYKPTAVEGFGIVYAEAGYMGLPVIAGKSGGVNSVVLDGYTGFIFDQNESQLTLKIADKLIQLYTNKDFYNFISINAHDFIETKFDWKLYGEKLIENLI